MKNIMSKQAAEAVKLNGWDIEYIDDSFLYMDVVIYFNRRGRDADNIFKALQDSMQGIVFKNDSQLLPRTQRILYDKENPRVELTFTLVKYVGIFNDQEHADEFASNCESCARYLNGRCSILVDSLRGTIRAEIDEDLICNTYKEKK